MARLLANAKHSLVAQLLPLEPLFQGLTEEGLKRVCAVAGSGISIIHLLTAAAAAAVTTTAQQASTVNYNVTECPRVFGTLTRCSEEKTACGWHAVQLCCEQAAALPCPQNHSNMLSGCRPSLLGHTIVPMWFAAAQHL